MGEDGERGGGGGDDGDGPPDGGGGAPDDAPSSERKNAHRELQLLRGLEPARGARAEELPRGFDHLVNFRVGHAFDLDEELLRDRDDGLDGGVPRLLDFLRVDGKKVVERRKEDARAREGEGEGARERARAP